MLLVLQRLKTLTNIKIRVMNKTNIKLNNSKGFTLLEALLGFLILSIGMLGIASLQAISLKAGKTSVYGSVAMMKVEEILESMRANPSALATYVSAGGGAFKNCVGGAKNCNAAELAEEDLFWWNKNLAAGLPGVVGTNITTSIVLTAATSPSNMANIAVSVSWLERKQDAAGTTTKTFSTAADICTKIPC